MPKRKRGELKELTADDQSLIAKVQAFDPPLSEEITSTFITWIKESHYSTKSKFFNHQENAAYLKPFLEILGGCGADKNNITSINAMLWSRNDLQNIAENKDEATAILKICIEQNILSSITGMQHARGMISKEDFTRLKNLCSDAAGNLDQTLLKSITGMQHARGMISNYGLTRLKNLCSDAAGTLDKTLLSSITGMQNGKGMFSDNKYSELIELKSALSDVKFAELFVVRRKNTVVASASSNSSAESFVEPLINNQVPSPPSPQAAELREKKLGKLAEQLGILSDVELEELVEQRRKGASSELIGLLKELVEQRRKNAAANSSSSSALILTDNISTPPSQIAANCVTPLLAKGARLFLC